MRAALGDVPAIATASADVVHWICVCLAMHACLQLVVDQARHVIGGAACGMCDTVRVLTLRQNRALHVANIQEKLLVLEASTWFVRADGIALLHACNVETAAETHVVLAALAPQQVHRCTHLLATARPSVLPEGVRIVRENGALLVAQARVVLFIISTRVTIVQMLPGCDRQCSGHGLRGHGRLRLLHRCLRLLLELLLHLPLLELHLLLAVGRSGSPECGELQKLARISDGQRSCPARGR